MSQSRELLDRALRVFPGGVNSPVRAAVKPYPFFVEKAEGPYLYTVDGEKLIDLVQAYGPLILGHRHPRVEKAILEQLSKGWIYAAPHEVEIKLAEKILKYVRPGGMIRFVNSGTEATALAIRLARAVTKRKLIVKFDGCYHGAHDYVLVATGSAAEHYGVPASEGVPEEVAKMTLIADFNDFDSIEKLFREHGDRIAAVIVEPVLGNIGVVPPKKGFLKFLRELTEKYGSLLIFDEVITGFRLSLGGAQEYFGVKADIVTLGKIIGGGMPIGAVVSSAEIMKNLAPLGKVFNAGTFNAHPLAMAAGLATIEVLEEGETYTIASAAAKAIAKAIEDAAQSVKLDIYVNQVESMLTPFFNKHEVIDAKTARASNRALYEKFHIEMLKRKVFVTPSQFEAIFTGLPIRGEVLDKVIEAVYGAFRSLGELSK